ncbi:Hypothetical predicted protein [Marmota monax]|uniref:Carbonyl reductase [NADPH] 1 n=1 Tax=Marmota monax TaxID=9995 RepID=A0A5E4DJN2_MARMO|nr:Hypothetical predicted protein [Marmota monax]
MSSCRRVALVTGGNKGIGFAIVRDLCRQFSGDVGSAHSLLGKPLQKPFGESPSPQRGSQGCQ